MIKSTGFILVLALFFCCNDKSEIKLENNKEVKTFHQDIPLVKGVFSSLYTGTIWTRDFLGELDTLENGYDSLQIRLWYEGDSARKIVVIKKNKQWIAQCYTFRINNTNQDSVYWDELQMERSVPKMGWEKFVDSLIGLEVLHLPDQESIPNLSIYYNRSTVNVEIATKTIYRFYSYSAPVRLASDFEQAKKMVKIMKLIKTELGFDTDILNDRFSW